MSGGGSSPKIPTYYVGVQFGLCLSAIDKVTDIWVGEKEAWTGVNTGTTISIDAEELFGGLPREGGVSGNVDIDIGLPAQPPNSYLSSVLGAVPAARGISTAILNSVYVGTNYYLKPWWFVCSRIHQDYRGNPQWQDALAEPITDQMNGVHIIRECLIDGTFGMGEAEELIDETSFLAAAQTCFDEGLGFCFLWAKEAPIEDFIKIVSSHVGCEVYLDRATGKYKIELLREVPVLDIPSLPLLDESSIVSIKNFAKGSVGDLVSSVTIAYENIGTHQEDTVTITDNALYARQGAPVSKTKRYEGVATRAVAQLLAARDLQQETKPLYACTINCTRVAEDFHLGKAFRLHFPDYIDEEIVFRVISINLGTATKRNIAIQCIQDVFSAPTTLYQTLPDSAWVDPINLPQDSLHILGQETPFYVLALQEGDIFANEVDPTETFIVMAAVTPTQDTYGAEVWSKVGAGDYTYGDGLDFCMSATLSGIVSKVDTTLLLENITNLALFKGGSFAQLGSEMVQVTSISSGVATVVRGVMDTVPEDHAIGARLWNWDNRAGTDKVTYLTSETPYVKLLTTTAKGTLSLDDATTTIIPLDGRLHKPYPPANVAIGGAYFPATATTGGVSFDITWATRNRLQQTANLTDWYAGSITTEVGVTYSASLKRTDTSAVLDSFTGNATTTATLTTAYVGEVILTLWSVRGGLNSHQTVSHTFDLVI